MKKSGFTGKKPTLTKTTVFKEKAAASVLTGKAYPIVPAKRMTLDLRAPVSASTIPEVPTAITAFVGSATAGPVNVPLAVDSFAQYALHFDTPGQRSPMSLAVEQYFHNGGRQAWIVRVAGDGEEASEASIIGSAAEGTGIHALDNVDLFNLLCLLPPAPARDVELQTWIQAAAYCLARRAILIVDPPANATPSTVLQWSDVLRGALGQDRCKNAALWFPRLRYTDPDDVALQNNAVSCGAIAGIIARTDASKGVWKAAAGADATFAGINDLSLQLNAPQSDLLNNAAINTLRSFPGTGHVVWGARTMAGAASHASEWRYLPVRRLALFIEESIHRGTRWAVFEPNAEPLWQRLQQQVSAFLQSLFRKGAFQGQKAEHAFFVRCNRSTHSQSDLDQGIVNIEVGIAPVKPAEFIILRFCLNTKSL